MAEQTPQKFKAKNGKEFIVRPLTVDDAEKQLEHGMHIFETSEHVLNTPEEFKKMTLEKEREWIESFSDKPNSIQFTAISNNTIIAGVGLGGGHRKKLAHTATLGMGVNQDWRGQGVGNILMEVIIEWAKSNPNLEKINLSVMSTNTAGKALYDKFNFKEDGRRFRQFKQLDGSYADEILMSLEV